MNNFLKYKGYFGTVQYSEEDNLLFGKLAGIRSLVSYDGSSLEELKSNFIEAVDHYLEVCEAHNQEPNKTSIEELKKTINEEAQKTINNLIAM